MCSVSFCMQHSNLELLPLELLPLNLLPRDLLPHPCPRAVASPEVYEAAIAIDQLLAIYLLPSPSLASLPCGAASHCLANHLSWFALWCCLAIYCLCKHFVPSTACAAITIYRHCPCCIGLPSTMLYWAAIDQLRCLAQVVLCCLDHRVALCCHHHCIVLPSLLP